MSPIILWVGLHGRWVLGMTRPVGCCELAHLGPRFRPIGAGDQQRGANLQPLELVLLEQYRPHQPGDDGVVGGGTYATSAALDLIVHTLQQFDAPDLATVELGDMAVSDVFPEEVGEH